MSFTSYNSPQPEAAPVPAQNGAPETSPTLQKLFAPKKLFALVDCNNFYASCERLFCPDLAQTPIVVLSNNDGCIVSRSAEAKALGIGMGEPEFLMRPLLRKHGVAVFSSNYALYGDISQRVMHTLESLCPHVEQYSIDEAFVRLDAPLVAQAEDVALTLRQRVRQWTGMTVSVGVGPTRTLAKLANALAKKHASGIAHVDGPDSPSHARALQAFAVEDIWGIGRKQAAKCHARGIRTAWQLAQAQDIWIKNTLTVTGWQTALELRGIACIGMNTAPVPRKTLVSSRSFAHKIYDIAALREALACFTARAAERLRREQLMASGLGVHIRSARTELHGPHDYHSHIPLPLPTNDTLSLIRAAHRGLESLFAKGNAYAKAGIVLFGLEKQNSVQGNLLAFVIPEAEQPKEAAPALNTALDKLNRRYGKRTLYYGAEGGKSALWHMRQKHCSPAMTSDWKALAKANLS